MTKRPVEQQEAVSAFYAKSNFDVSYFSALWHTFKVAHLMTNNLERICRAHGLSYADVDFIGAIRVDELAQQRATDLAQMLNVSDAVLSTRIAKLEKKGLLVRIPRENDRRALELQLTVAGIAASDAVLADITSRSNFVRCFHRLSEEDQQALTRIMGKLHNELDRDFISTTRGKL